MKQIDPDTGLTTPELVDRHDDPIRPGDSVRLTDKHSHAGKVATYEGCRRTVGGLWGAQVRLEDGTTVMVWRNIQWEACNGA